MGKPDYSTPESAAALVTFLAEIPDPRSRRGRRYEWLYLLTLIAVALLAGESTLVGISQWVEAQGPELVRALQPRCRCVPSMATLRRVLCRVPIAALEAAVDAYVCSLQTGRGACGQVVTATGERLYGQAVDGKTVRCATAHGRWSIWWRSSATKMDWCWRRKTPPSN